MTTLSHLVDFPAYCSHYHQWPLMMSSRANYLSACQSPSHTSRKGLFIPTLHECGWLKWHFENDLKNIWSRVNILLIKMKSKLPFLCLSTFHNNKKIVTFSLLQMSRLHCSVSGVRLSVAWWAMMGPRVLWSVRGRERGVQSRPSYTRACPVSGHLIGIWSTRHNQRQNGIRFYWFVFIWLDVTLHWHYSVTV